MAFTTTNISLVNKEAYTHAFRFSGCTDDIVTSDHSPVFATFEVGVTSQFVSKKGTNL